MDSNLSVCISVFKISISILYVSEWSESDFIKGERFTNFYKSECSLILIKTIFLNVKSLFLSDVKMHKKRFWQQNNISINMWIQANSQ